jgi:hypothetical protein
MGRAPSRFGTGNGRGQMPIGTSALRGTTPGVPLAPQRPDHRCRDPAPEADQRDGLITHLADLPGHRDRARRVRALSRLPSAARWKCQLAPSRRQAAHAQPRFVAPSKGSERPPETGTRVEKKGCRHCRVSVPETIQAKAGQVSRSIPKIRFRRCAQVIPADSRVRCRPDRDPGEMKKPRLTAGLDHQVQAPGARVY